MPLTVEDIEEQIEQLESSLDGVSEVSFEGETTKYRSVAEIQKAIAFLTRKKKSLTTPRSKYMTLHKTIDRGLS